MRRKYQSLSTTCRIEYINSESYSLDTFSDKQIEKNVKLYKGGMFYEKRI